MPRSGDHKLELADGEYMLLKERAKLEGRATTVTIPMMEKRYGLKPGTLLNYRANNYRKKHR